MKLEVFAVCRLYTTGFPDRYLVKRHIFILLISTGHPNHHVPEQGS
jgi:hypothetical protein